VVGSTTIHKLRIYEHRGKCQPYHDPSAADQPSSVVTHCFFQPPSASRQRP